MINEFRLPRRTFFQQAAAASCGFALHALRPSAAVASSTGYASAETAPGATKLRTQQPARANAAPVVVVSAPVATDVNPRAPAYPRRAQYA